EQHCDGASPALRGEVQVTNPPPPPPIAAHLTVDDTAQLARGGAAVHGTISCSREPDPDQSTIVLDVSEPTKSGDRTGAIVLGLGSCPATPVAWSVTVPPSDPKSPFVKGTATVHAVPRLRDLFCGNFVEADSVTAAPVGLGAVAHALVEPPADAAFHERRLGRRAGAVERERVHVERPPLPDLLGEDAERVLDRPVDDDRAAHRLHGCLDAAHGSSF